MGRPGGPGPLDPIFDVDTVYGQFAFDNTPGTPRLPVTINQAAGQDDPTTTVPILFTAVFSRAVTGFATGDVTITGTAGASVGVVTEVAPFDGTTYEVAVSDVVTQGTVTATILAGVCVAVDDGMQNGHSTSTDNTVEYAIAFVEEFCDPLPPGALTWDAQYTRSDWALLDLGGGGFTVSGGIASTTSTNPTKEIKHAATTDRNQWGSVLNARDWTAGNDGSFRILLNVGLDGVGSGAGAASYYWASMGRSAGVPTVAIGKWWNGGDVTIASTPLTVDVDSVLRFRHDGIGGLAIDVDGLEVLAAQDTDTSTTGCWLRALGIGIGGNTGGTAVSVGDPCFGIWGEGTTPPPAEPDPWSTADAQDTNMITGGLWAQSNAPWPSYSTATVGTSAVLYQSSGTSNTYSLALTDASQLSADQFCEATLRVDSSVLDCYINLRATAGLAAGYYFRWSTTAGGQWEIGKHGTGVIASAAAASPGDYRIRCEAQGTALRLYHWTGGAWSLKVNTTDGAVSAANNVRLAFNDVFAQGIPYIHDVVVGNL